MTDDYKNIPGEKRIRETLRLAEERGYNLTLEQLSKNLLGGSVPSSEVEVHLKTMTDIDSDGIFFATRGNLHSEKCRARQQSDAELQPLYTQIATRFLSEYLRLCPWVHCIMISGSMASDGLAQGDDIDFDFIVPDGVKYTSYLLALLLSFVYSFRYGKRFWRRYVICISVIWETRQVLPFQRTDGQMAFELLNAKVVYNPDFFQFLLHQNPWLQSYFPQLFQPNRLGVFSFPLQTRKRYLKIFVEKASKKILFLIVKVAIPTIFKDHNIPHRMKIKYPYALFDEP